MWKFWHSAELENRVDRENAITPIFIEKLHYEPDAMSSETLFFHFLLWFWSLSEDSTNCYDWKRGPKATTIQSQL